MDRTIADDLSEVVDSGGADQVPARISGDERIEVDHRAAGDKTEGVVRGIAWGQFGVADNEPGAVDGPGRAVVTAEGAEVGHHAAERVAESVLDGVERVD